MRRVSIVALLLLAGLVPAVASAQYQPWEGAEVIQDAEWRKRFLGTYGFLSGAEPEVNALEVEQLREVIEVMKVDTRAASAMLAAQAGDGSSAALDFILANLEFQNGQLEQAKAHYQSALKKFPDFRRAHKNLGLLLVQESSFEEALVHLSRAVELGDRDGRSYGLMGYCYINRENYLAAEIAYRNAILQDPDTKDWKLGLARALMAIQHYKEAVALFQVLIAEDPEDPTLWMLQANGYVGLDRPMDAAVNLEAVRLMGKGQNSGLVLLGDIYMNAGMPELAKSAYLEVIESDQGATEFDTAYRAAELLIRAQAYDDARDVLRSIDKRYAKELTEDDELQLLTLKAKVARAQGREAEAAELLESIVQRDGTRGEALLELAAYQVGQGNVEKAVMLMEQAERLDAFEYRALLAHAQLMVTEKDYQKGAELLRRAIAIRQEPRVQTFLARVEQAIRRR